MLGSMVLWIFWPSFCSAVVPSADLARTAIATVLALCGSTLATFVASTLLRKGRPFFADMANAALAGGVAVGATCNVISPAAAFVVGLLAGTLCTVGYVVIQPRVDAALKIVDTCGVHNLHGMPGLLGARSGFRLQIDDPRVDSGLRNYRIRQTHPVRAAIEQPRIGRGGHPTCGGDGAVGIVGKLDLPGPACRRGHRFDQAAQPATVGDGAVEQPTHLGRRGAGNDVAEQLQGALGFLHLAVAAVHAGKIAQSLITAAQQETARKRRLTGNQTVEAIHGQGLTPQLGDSQSSPVALGSRAFAAGTAQYRQTLSFAQAKVIAHQLESRGLAVAAFE
jgi:hypothetical protein